VTSGKWLQDGREGDCKYGLAASDVLYFGNAIGSTGVTLPVRGDERDVTAIKPRGEGRGTHSSATGT